MKIKAVELVRVVRADGPAHASGAQAGSTLSASAAPAPKSRPRRKAWPTEIEVANPMSRFPRFKPRRQLYAARQWPGFAVKITAEDGTWGLGSCAGRPAAAATLPRSTVFVFPNSAVRTMSLPTLGVLSPSGCSEVCSGVKACAAADLLVRWRLMAGRVQLRVF